MSKGHSLRRLLKKFVLGLQRGPMLTPASCAEMRGTTLLTDYPVGLHALESDRSSPACCVPEPSVKTICIACSRCRLHKLR